MAQKVIGVDLGEHAVKVAVLETGFRQSNLVDFIERAVPEGDEPYLTRCAKVLGELITEHELHDAVSYAAVPGDLVSIRVLELPFTDQKKLDQVIGFELESQIPHAIEDVVLDHHVIASGEGSKVLCAAARRDTVRDLLKLLEEAGTQPRALYVAPLCYAAVAARALPSEPGPFAIVDVGHLRTNVCVVKQGKLTFGRTLSRGGRHLTLALAAAYQMRYEDAERGKLQVGAVGSAERPLDLKYALIDSTLRDALAPLLRDLRQTFSFYRAQFGEAVQMVFLCGGSSRLRGLPEFIADDTGVTAVPLQLRPEDRSALIDAESSQATVPLALAVAAAGAGGRKELDFRRGEFGYKVDYSFLRAKSFHLAGCFLALLAFAAIDAYAALTKLRGEEVVLEARLKSATVELFHKEVTDPKNVSLQIKAMLKGGMGDLPLPEETAYDLLDDMSRKLPTGDDKKLDVLELDIKPKKTFIKGTITSAAAVDEIVTALKTIRCYDDIQKGPIQNVVGQDVKQFTLTLVGKCP